MIFLISNFHFSQLTRMVLILLKAALSINQIHVLKRSYVFLQHTISNGSSLTPPSFWRFLIAHPTRTSLDRPQTKPFAWILWLTPLILLPLTSTQDFRSRRFSNQSKFLSHFWLILCKVFFCLCFVTFLHYQIQRKQHHCHHYCIHSSITIGIFHISQTILTQSLIHSKHPGFFLFLRHILMIPTQGTI